MIKKIMLLLLIHYISFPVLAQENNIEFIEKIYDGSWGRYIGIINKGPFFLDEETVVLIDDKNNLVSINVLNHNEDKIALETRTNKLYKINNKIIVRVNNLYFQFNGSELIPTGENIELTNNIFYSFRKGLYYLESGEISYFNFPGIKLNVSSLLDTPVLSHDSNQIYFTVRNNDFYGSLYRYSIQDNELILLNEKTRHFTLISDKKILIYEIDSNFSLMRMSEFPGDFSLIDSMNGIELYNTDELFFNMKKEFAINDFDFNGASEIVSFGGLFRFSDGKISESYSPVLFLRLID